MNTPQSEDVLVVEFPEEPNWRMYYFFPFFFIFFNFLIYVHLIFSGAEVSDCGRYLIITTAKDCRFNLLFFADLSLTPSVTGKLKLTQVVYKYEGDFEVNFDTKKIFCS